MHQFKLASTKVNNWNCWSRDFLQANSIVGQLLSNIVLETAIYFDTSFICFDSWMGDIEPVKNLLHSSPQVVPSGPSLTYEFQKNILDSQNRQHQSTYFDGATLSSYIVDSSSASMPM